ncbi:hypothetical protein V8E36_006528 [Tilletia maclaganii]
MISPLLWTRTSAHFPSPCTRQCQRSLASSPTCSAISKEQVWSPSTRTTRSCSSPASYRAHSPRFSIESTRWHKRRSALPCTLSKAAERRLRLHLQQQQPLAPRPFAGYSNLLLLLTPLFRRRLQLLHAQTAAAAAAAAQAMAIRMHQHQHHPHQHHHQQQAPTHDDQAPGSEGGVPAERGQHAQANAHAHEQALLLPFAPPSDPAFALPARPGAEIEGAADDEDDRPPAYTQNRTLSSITEVWREYAEGINGGPAVQTLETDWQHRWRAGTAARKCFSQRNKLYKIVQQLAVQRHITPAAAAQALDDARLAMKRSVDWCQKNAESLLSSVASCSSSSSSSQ